MCFCRKGGCKMDSRILLIFFALLSFASCKTRGRGEALMKRQCKRLCGTLTRRFKNNDIYTAEKAIREIHAICREDSTESKNMCKHFSNKAARIAMLAEDSSTSKICRTLCDTTLINMTVSVSNDNRKPNISRCDQCKSKVKIASNIARLLQVSLVKVIDVICPSLPLPDLGSWLMCRDVVKKIAASSRIIDTVQNRICSALNLCKSSAVPADSCALGSSSRRSSAFEISFKIFNIITQVARPHLEERFPKLGRSFDLIDETAKCLSAKQSSTPDRSARRNRKTYVCHRLCSKVDQTVRNKLAGRFNEGSQVRRSFESFCSGLRGPSANKCGVLHKATDNTAILETLFQKQTCERLRCDLYEMYPSWHCNLCKFNVMQPPIRMALTNAMNTITEIEKSIEMLCRTNIDHRCDDFLAEHRRFLRSLGELLKHGTVCKVIGMCKE